MLIMKHSSLYLSGPYQRLTTGSPEVSMPGTQGARRIMLELSAPYSNFHSLQPYLLMCSGISVERGAALLEYVLGA